MKKKEFLEMVMTEIETIKERATPEEIGKLDFESLRVQTPKLCIYGQMTGHCQSERANEISHKVFAHIAIDENFNQLSFTKWEKHVSGKHVTSLEVYITMKGAKNKQVIQYLKGEINTLKL